MSEQTAGNDELIKKNRHEPGFIWFLLAFAIGLGLRLVLLGSMTYAQNELVLVNQALQISQKVSTATSTVPVYSGLTSFLFFLFGPGNLLGRIVPAVVGSSLVLFPGSGRAARAKSTLILSFALALDPTFLVFSHQSMVYFAIAGYCGIYYAKKGDRAGWFS